MRFKLGAKVRVKQIPEGTKSKDNTLTMWNFMTKYCGKEYEIVDFYQDKHYVLSNTYIFPKEWLELAEKPRYILGNKLTQEQVNVLPNGMKIFIKEPELSLIGNCIYTIKDDKLIDENNGGFLFKSKLEEYKETAYEVCVFKDMQEVTTQEELLSLEDGTYVFAYESSRDIGNSLCVKQGCRANEIYSVKGYDLLDLEWYQERGVKFYIDKNIKLTKEEIINIEVKIKENRISIDIDEDYHAHTYFDVNDESDKLEAISRLLKGLPEEFERRSKMVKYEEFTPNQWVSFLNGEIAIKCKSEEKAKEFLGVLHSMGHTWFSGRSLTEYTHYSNDRTYTFNHGVQWGTDYTKKPIFLYK